MATEKGVPLYYLATMIPADDEDQARIRRHLSEREGWGFDTIEQGCNILNCLPVSPLSDDSQGPTAPKPLTLSGAPIDSDGVFLLDSVTALLSNEMFLPDGTVDLEAGKRLAGELATFAQRTGNTIFVSDYIYSDPRSFDDQDDYTEVYRRSLALLDRTLAQICGQVIEVTFGMKYLYK